MSKIGGGEMSRIETTPWQELDTVRKGFYELDEVLEKRFNAAKEIGRLKKETGKSTKPPNTISEPPERVITLASENNLSKMFIIEIWKSLYQVSYILQDNVTAPKKTVANDLDNDIVYSKGLQKFQERIQELDREICANLKKVKEILEKELPDKDIHRIILIIRSRFFQFIPFDSTKEITAETMKEKGRYKICAIPNTKHHDNQEKKKILEEYHILINATKDFKDMPECFVRIGNSIYYIDKYGINGADKKTTSLIGLRNSNIDPSNELWFLNQIVCYKGNLFFLTRNPGQGSLANSYLNASGKVETYDGKRSAPRLLQDLSATLERNIQRPIVDIKTLISIKLTP